MARAFSKRAICVSQYSRSSTRSESATAKCEYMPSMTMLGDACRTSRTAPRSSSTTPMRCIPVSTLTCTGVSPPASCAAVTAACAPSSDPTVRVSLASRASASDSAGASASKRIGSVMPPSRSSTPSSTMATAKPATPASNRARAAKRAPCPYPLAFTTPQSWAGAMRWRNVVTLWRIAIKSISAHAGRRVPSIAMV